MFFNVRGGSWFSHKPHDAAAASFQAWLEDARVKKHSIVILEIGSGFNTPTVTRFPMESLAADVERMNARLVRMNPADWQVPGYLKSKGRAVELSLGAEEGLRELSGEQLKLHLRLGERLAAAPPTVDGKSAFAPFRSGVGGRGGTEAGFAPHDDDEGGHMHDGTSAVGHLDWVYFFESLRQ